MGRLNKARSPASLSLRRRFTRTVFLPEAACIAAAAVCFAIYAFCTLRSGRTAAVIFALCAGAALILALHLLGSAYLD